MKKITFLFICLIGFFSFAQVNITANFDSGTPADWTDDFTNTTDVACAGSSERHNTYGSNTTANLTTPNQVGASNATDLVISFDYKIIEYFSSFGGTPDTPTAPGWGTIEVQYSLDDGVSWTTSLLIDDSNHTTSGSCANISTTVAGASLPSGSDVKVQIINTHAAGDYFLYVDNFAAQQDLGCVPPAGTATFASEDCAAGTFDVDFDITDLGDGSPVLFDGTTSTPISAVGPFTLTYPVGTPVTFILQHGVSAVCDVNLGTIADSGLCPIQATVDCSAGTPVNTTFCYDNGADIRYVFTSTDGTALRVDFIEGYFEDCCDPITIYDGGEITDAVLFASDTNFNNDATGITAISSGDTVLVRLTSDGSASCASGSGSGIPLNFNVACNTCTPATANATIVSDCDTSGGFNIELDVTDLGTATTLTLSDDQGSAAQSVNAIGIFTFGPFVNGTDVTLTLVDDSDASCTVVFSSLSQELCPPANDECTAAEALTVNADLNDGVVTAGTTAGATASAQADDVTGTPNTDVWYSFVATSEQHVISILNVVNQGGGTSTSTDMGMGVYDATSGCAALVFTDDSDPNTLSLSGLMIGTSYVVRVYGWGTTIQNNNFDISVGTPPPPPANDLCTGSETLPFATVVNGTTISATGANGPTSCNGSIGNDVWYTLTGDGGDITIEVIAANEGAQIGIYESTDGTCAGFTEGTCFDSVDDLGALTTEITFTSVLGTTYYINLGAWVSSGDDFDFTISANSTLSTEDFNNPSAFSYFPNPVKNTLTLNAQNTIENVTMYNMLGQEVLRATPNAVASDLDMSSLQTGTYFVKVTIANTTQTIRVIKQ